jgi:hypothetical protein
MDQNDAHSTTMRSDMQKLAQRARLFDFDLQAWFLLSVGFRQQGGIFLGFWAKKPEIRMIPLRKPSAGRTPPTRHEVFPGLFTEKRFRESPRQVEFADSSLPRDQQGMGQTFSPRVQPRPGVGMQGIYIHKYFINNKLQ